MLYGKLYVFWFLPFIINTIHGLYRSSSQVSDTIPHLKFEEKMVKQFELKLTKFIEDCEKHIDWLMKGSRKVCRNMFDVSTSFPVTLLLT